MSRVPRNARCRRLSAASPCRLWLEKSSRAAWPWSAALQTTWCSKEQLRRVLQPGKKKRIKLINASCACGEIQSVPPVLGKLFVSGLELLNEFPYIICQGSAGELAAALSSLLVTWDYCQIISCSVDGSVRALQMMANARLEDALSEPWFLPG